jgi:anti-sigma regulatory factor (Ser/Thr protein kinase)
MPGAGTDHFRHEALFYEGEDGLLAGTLPFIREGTAREEPVLVALDERGNGAVRRALEADADPVRFVDMGALGRNPARIISVWRDFLADGDGGERPVRGIGEPVWPGRGEAELSECDRHEALVNLAFAGARGFTLLCPYDSGRLDASVLESARRNHPLIREPGEPVECDDYVDPRARDDLLGAPLPGPDGKATELGFRADGLASVRAFARDRARAAGLGAPRQADVEVAVNELTTNSVRHGGGAGAVRIWSELAVLVCEVSDAGWITDPLVGRRRPMPSQRSGRGLWIVNQLCDLVQIRSGPNGTTVRMSVNLA